MTRFIVIGAGAVGVSFAAELERAGHAVVLVARGAQLEAADAGGLRYVRPDGERRLESPVVAGPETLELRQGDVLVLATKTQDVAAALALWAGRPVVLEDGTQRRAGDVLPVLTTQNGLEAERLALRWFATVIGVVVWTAASYVEPGVVASVTVPARGMLWLGLAPHGHDPQVAPLAQAFRDAGFEAVEVDDIDAWKAAKLLLSVTFALDALYPPSALRDRAAALLSREADDVLRASGLEPADLAGASAALADRCRIEPLPGHTAGTSAWQSLARGGTLETDFLNGEVVLQARLCGRTAPANAAITARMHAAADAATPPASLSDADLAATLPAAAVADVLIDVHELQAALSGPTPPAVLDVRWALDDPDGRRHHAAGHIPAAVYVDLDTELAAPPSAAQGRHPLPALDDLQAAARRWGLRQDQPVVVYDASGGLAAGRAWWLLRWAGLPDVRLLDGGLQAWTDAGYALETGSDPVATGDVVLGADALPVLSADEAAELARTGVLLDARAGERFRGEVEPIDPRAGHVPGAVSAATTDNLAADRTFLDAGALRERFAALGVDGSVPVGVYCGSGVTAAHTVAALRLLGIEAALYPGSWSAWSADPARPVAVGP